MSKKEEQLPIWKNPKTEYWYENFTTSDGERHRKSLRTKIKSKALEIAKKRATEYNNQKTAYTFQYAVFKFFEEEDRLVRSGILRPKTIKNYEVDSKALLEFFKDFYLEELTVLKLKDYILFRKLKNKSDGKIRSELTTLSVIINKSMENSLLPLNLNPALVVKKTLNSYKPNKRYLNLDELKILIKKSNKHLRRLIVFLIESGCRISETLKAKFTDLIPDKNGNCYLAIPKENNKTKKLKYIFLNELIMKIIVKQKREFPKSLYIFTDSKGNSYITTPKTALKRAFERAGIKPAGFHIFRHTNATLSKQKGLSNEEIASNLGHSNPITTKNYIADDFETQTNCQDFVKRPILLIDTKTNK